MVRRGSAISASIAARPLKLWFSRTVGAQPISTGVRYLARMFAGSTLPVTRGMTRGPVIAREPASSMAAL